MEKLFAFDMDGTLLSARSIRELAKFFGFKQQLEPLLGKNSKESAEEIAGLLKGRKTAEIETVASTLRFSQNAQEVVNEIKNRNHRVVIITDGYDAVAQQVAMRLGGVDEIISLRLLSIGGKVSGVQFPQACFEGDYPTWKARALKNACREHGFNMKDCVAIGDNQVDESMLKVAGTAIAYKPKTKKLEEIADITTNDMRDVLKYA
ncbi:MAG: HAD family hydrolase [Candidatus Micrarchaeia archaeon]